MSHSTRSSSEQEIKRREVINQERKRDSSWSNAIKIVALDQPTTDPTVVFKTGYRQSDRQAKAFFTVSQTLSLQSRELSLVAWPFVRVMGFSCWLLLSSSVVSLSSCSLFVVCSLSRFYLEWNTSTTWYHQSDIMTSGSLSLCSVFSPHIYARAIPVRKESRPGRLPASLFSPLLLGFAFARFVSLSLSWISTSGQSTFVPNLSLFFNGQ